MLGLRTNTEQNVTEIIEPIETFLKEVFKKTKINLKPFQIAGDLNLNKWQMKSGKQLFKFAIREWYVTNPK